MQASLSQLWGMLNSMQIVVHMPMLQGLKFPANSMTIVGQMIKLATFDLIPTEIIDVELYYWPEEDPFSINFEMAGVESKLFLANIGFAIYLVYAHLLAVVVHACLHKMRNSGRCVTRLHSKLGSYLYWEGLNRFYMEIYFDYVFLSILNLHSIDW